MAAHQLSWRAPRERNPFDLADQKAKELRSRLEWAAGRLGLRVRVPFVQAAVLLSEPDLSCDLRPEERDFVYGPDRRPADGAGLPSVAELWTPNGSSPNPQSFEPVAEFGAALPALLAELGATAVPDDRSRAARVVPEAREQDDTAPIHPVDRTPEPRRPPVATRETDPWEAGPGDRLPGGAVVRAVVDAVAEVTSGSWEEDETRTLLVGAGDAQRLLRVAEAKAGAVRLEREARNLGQLAGAPTPRLLAGPHQLGGRTVLEVEFVAGPTLRDRLPAGKPLAKETLRRWGSDLLSTLEDLEAADVYHRNVTPDHIVLRHNDDREELTLIDFSQSSISLGNKGAGTLEYRGYGGLDARRYNRAAERSMVAVTLHEMTTGRLVRDDYLDDFRLGPFRRTSPMNSPCSSSVRWGTLPSRPSTVRPKCARCGNGPSTRPNRTAASGPRRRIRNRASPDRSSPRPGRRTGPTIRPTADRWNTCWNGGTPLESTPGWQRSHWC